MPVLITPRLGSLGGVLLGATLVLAAASPSPAEQEPTTHRLVIEQFAFVPETITVKQGDRIEWINRDLVPHTATSDEGAWDTERLDQDQSAAILFDEPGTLRYICAYHPVMRGAVIVTPR